MQNIPERLPLLLIEEGVVLPGATVRFRVHSKSSVEFIRTRLLRNSILANTIIGVIPLHPDEPTKSFDEIQKEKPVGSVVTVVQVMSINWPRPYYSIMVTGLTRFQVLKLEQEMPFPVAKIKLLERFPYEDQDKRETISPELQMLIEKFREEALKLISLLDSSLTIVRNVKKLLITVPSHQLADIFSALVNSSFQEKLDILETLNLEERFRKALPLLQRQTEGLRLMQSQRKNNPKKKPTSMFQINLESLNRLPPILSGKKPSLYNDEDGDDDAEDLENKLREIELPDHASKIVKRELKRMKKMSPQMPEYPMIRHYLELVADLPWNKSSREHIDIRKAKQDLDADHFAMEKVKRRVLEYLAVRQLNKTLKGPILCFVGPPGVGKTSIGRSIAKTLGREFHRISLGGVSDQSDIRGHRRTYIGSMPGRFIQALKTAGTNNPVFLLDEIDKMSVGIHGDPTAALLEVLDPEQNSNFVDHYLNMPYNLSQVLFIATANSMKTIPAALKDRLELITIPGYTIEDKLPIATKHLLPKQLIQHGLDQKMVHITEEAISFLVSKYTREAGVRELERKLASVCRSVAVRMAVAESKNDKVTSDQMISNMKILEPSSIESRIPTELPIVVDSKSIEDILGAPIYEDVLSDRLGQIGVAVGLAWTSVGGEVMVVEATKMPGDGELILTGQLGDVMKESATIALNWIRSHAKQLELLPDDLNIMESQDVHVHFPAGGVGKDGPSAGITITTALVSLLTERIVNQELCMTGEMTLRGVVLPVGGIKEKVIAAHRSGFKRIIIPKRNQKDVKNIPKSIKDSMDFEFVSNIEEVLEIAFDGEFQADNDPENKLTELSKL